jgi:hypothetical protein
MKLLCRAVGDTDYLTSDHQCAVLSQRLALEISSTTYVTGSSTRNSDMADKVQRQISHHMRVCTAIPEDLTTMHCVAVSEPILSEAASLIMRDDPNLNFPDALLNVLDSYAISPGDRGELLVAAFFTRARDLYARQIPRELYPDNPTQFCPIFSVTDLLSNLFQEVHFSTMLDSLPSVRRADFPSQKFGDVFRKTKMHFNHLIKPLKQEAIARPYLVAIMARGAAALGTNSHAGFDMVYPFLYDTSNLVIKKVGFIMVLVKNDSDVTPNAILFKRMDPFLCELLGKNDKRDFTIPIIRIVFSLGGGKPFLQPMRYNSLEQGAASFDADGYPQFTSYDFWCSGMGPGLLQPVDEDDAQTKWVTLLSKTDSLKWDCMFSTSKAPDVRRSQYPGGGDNNDHYDAWMMSNLPLDSE